MRLKRTQGSENGTVERLETYHLSAPMVEESGIQTSSHVDKDKIFSVLGPTSLAIICACVAAGLFIFTVLLLLVKNRRRRQKLLRDLTFDGYDETKITKSAPNSRCTSPKFSKRMSCPDALACRTKTAPSLLVRSLTSDPILDSTLPPECVQPKCPPPETVSITARRYSGSKGASHSPSNSKSTSPKRFSEDGGQNSSPDSKLNGKIWFSAIYDDISAQLEVNLIKVNNLPKPEWTNEDRVLFVKMYLLPDEKTYQVSKYKKNAPSQVFNETHTFQVPSVQVKERILRFSVYEIDKRRLRHSLGHISINLNEIDLQKGDVICSALEPNVQPTASLGELNLSLAYIPAKEKVKIGIHKARKLHLMEQDMDKGAFVRIQLFYGHKCHRIKRTVTRPITRDCPFEESLTFTIQGRQLESCSLVVSVMFSHPHEYNKTDVEYGRFVIGPFMYARGEELAHWQEMMSKPKNVTTRWHSLVPPTS